MSNIGGYDQHETVKKRSHCSVQSLLPLLPSLSAQQCPIVIVREDSTLTKRISYSENLKERLPVHCERHTPGINEISSSSSLHKGDTLKLKRNDNTTLMETELLNQRNSLRECHQIFVKLQQKLSKTSLKPSNTKKTNQASLGSHKFPDRQKCIKHARNTTKLIKNENGRNGLGALAQSQLCTKHAQNDTEKLPGQKYISCNEKGTRQSWKTSVQSGTSNHGDVTECANSMDTVRASDPKNVFYSERQSANVDNVPGAPPCTPNEVTSNRIASLSDIKSQRNVQQKLQKLQNKHMKREKMILEIARVKAAEKDLEQRKNLMEKQRCQIYSMNKILAELEYQNFLKSKSQIQGLPV